MIDTSVRYHIERRFFLIIDVNIVVLDIVSNDDFHCSILIEMLDIVLNDAFYCWLMIIVLDARDAGGAPSLSRDLPPQSRSALYPSLPTLILRTHAMASRLKKSHGLRI